LTGCSHEEAHQIKPLPVAVLFDHDRAPPVEPLDQHRQLGCRHGNPAGRGLEPDEAAMLEALGKKAQARAIPPERLQPIDLAAAEQEQLAAEGSRRSTCCTCAAKPSNALRMSTGARAR
jgi:hypothetical protein